MRGCSWPSHVCQRRTSRSVWKEKKMRRKKLPLVRYRLDSQRVQVTGRLVHWMCACVCDVVALHRRPRGIRWSKEKKGEETETDMKSKATEGVPVVHTRTTRFWSFSLSLSFLICVGRVFPFFLSLSFGSCWFNLRGLLHYYHRPSAYRKGKELEEKEHELHTQKAN